MVGCARYTNHLVVWLCCYCPYFQEGGTSHSVSAAPVTKSILAPLTRSVCYVKYIYHISSYYTWGEKEVVFLRRPLIDAPQVRDRNLVFVINWDWLRLTQFSERKISFQSGVLLTSSPRSPIIKRQVTSFFHGWIILINLKKTLHDNFHNECFFCLPTIM